MAERRMFAKTIIDSDAFLTLPLSSQALYFHLSMRGDDEGFVNKPKSIMRTIGSNEDDLKLLIAKNFIIPFESGVVVIKHWKIHNYIRGDRIKDTVYQDEKALLKEKGNGSYSLNQAVTECQSNVSQVSDKCQHRLGKVSIGKDSINKDKTALEIAIDDFKEFRKKIKSPMTDRAVELLKTNLAKLSKDDETKIKILEKSIYRGWKGVFPLTNDNGKPNVPQRGNFEQRKYSDEYFDSLYENIEADKSKT